MSDKHKPEGGNPGMELCCPRWCQKNDTHMCVIITPRVLPSKISFPCLYETLFSQWQLALPPSSRPSKEIPTSIVGACLAVCHSSTAFKDA